MRINLKKRFTALMLAGMMVTSNVLPAYSATDGIAVEQADASSEGRAEEAGTALSVGTENDIAGEAGGGHHLNRMIPESRWPMPQIPTAPPMLLPMQATKVMWRMPQQAVLLLRLLRTMLRPAFHRGRQQTRRIPLCPATHRAPTADQIPVLLRIKKMQTAHQIPARLLVQRT